MKRESTDRDLFGGYAARPPILQAALDIDRMTRMLAPLLQPIVQYGPIYVEYAELLAYKRGRRAIVRYDIRARGYSSVVLGKVYADLERARDVHTTMKLLWTTVFDRSPAFGVPRPLGYLRVPGMLVYVPAEGRYLNEFVRDGNALDRFAQAGRWLGTLHRKRLPLFRRLDLMRECVKAKTWADLLCDCYPDMASRANRLSETLGEQAAMLQITTNVPVHKDFHCGHVVAGDGFWVIDFDEMRLGDPNCDIAHFCAYLDLLALRMDIPVEGLRDAFTDAYAGLAAWAPNPCFDWFYAYTCLKIIKQLCTVHGLYPRPVGAEQRRQVEVMSALALRSLGIA
jgi:hypothetical protein